MLMSFRKVATSDRPVRFNEQWDIKHLVSNRQDITAVTPLTADLSAESREDDVVDVHGKLTIGMDMLCSRCLKPLSEHFHIDFHEQFKQGKQPEELSEDDDTLYVDEDSVNLTEYAEGTFLLDLPFVPLCSETCKGLCPKCGHELNEGDCGCDNRVIDPRLAGLKDFFK
ncbi:hypothetical protein PAECIP112173_00614 [Paenibacillus sp. JJ-100]|uniref:YceD family protein n=1 Tax=Paenibacillus sp. JJ-100 TaxID=2974896 RepID=UPI0022FF7067|nr:DUF177 domain-containing protein [Paenibacillus sp. JJ-100]CAI6030483.1 hypothetical protein PAECIP112173_00614 [Paenibacillus sp. JJ-100]